MKYSYKTTGSHCKQIDYDIENDIVLDIKFHGGCIGSLDGLGAIIRGMKIDDVIARLKGVPCSHWENTSCADQIARGLEEAVANLKGLEVWNETVLFLHDD